MTARHVGILKLAKSDSNGMRGYVRHVFKSEVMWHTRLPGYTPQNSTVGFTAASLAGLLEYYKGAVYTPACKRRGVAC